MKNSNKGFATSFMIFSLLILFLIVVSILIINMNNSILLNNLFKNKVVNDNEMNDLSYIETDEVYEYDYKNSAQEFIAPKNGYYKFELWGGSGGQKSEENKAPGAYTSGILKLNKNQVLYIYTGEMGGYCNTTAFNGGGTLGCYGDNNNGGGGGATDVRIINGQWNNSKSLASRIMVAAGGGGGVTPIYQMAYGGSLSSKQAHSYSDTAGNATQTSGYAFGYGQSNTRGSGGGGYYGGSATYYVGSGGSSFISGYLGSVAIKSNSTTSPRNDSYGQTCTNNTNDIVCSYHYSNMIFKNTIMKSGEEEMPTFDGTTTMIGNKNNGHAKITKVEYKDESENPSDETTEYKYSFKGTYQTFNVPESGIYKIEAWGAGGGSSRVQGALSSNNLGKGGYTSGTIELVKDEILYIYVGGQGTDAVVGQDVPGGYNGGGLGTWDNSDDEASAGGGGATDIRLYKSADGLWNDSTSLASRIMVAGAGGGKSYNYEGGYGGGLSGYSVFPDVSSPGTQLSGYAFGIGQNASGIADNDGVAGGGAGYYGGHTSNTSKKSSGAGGSSYISGHLGCIAITSASDLTQRTDSNGSTCSIESALQDSKCSEHYSGKVFSNTVMKAGNEEMPTFDGSSTMTGNSGNGYVKITKVDN